MLYVTTRNRKDAFTAFHTLNQDRGAADGLFVPMKFPVFTKEDWKNLSEMSFNQRVAEMLNLFLGTKLTSWDVDFSAGRYPVRLEELPYKIRMAELWHNVQGQYDNLEQKLRQLLEANAQADGNWITVAIRMALLAGVIAEACETGDVDIAMVGGDFSAPVSAWYLRKMGFPVGNIICCCNENKQLWDLLCHGQMRTDDEVQSTLIPEADVVLPVNLERLLWDCGGESESMRYLEACSGGRVYTVSEAMLNALRKGLYVSVVSSARVENAIPNVYTSHKYLLTPASALAYSGLLDYRSKTGITRTAVVLCDNSPLRAVEAIAETMNLPQEAVKKMF